MSTVFLELGDGVLVEIGPPSGPRTEMHTSTAEQVNTTMRMVASKAGDIVRPLAATFGQLNDALDVPVVVDTAEVELGLSFSAEGQIFIAKSKAEGTLKIKVVFKTTQSRPTSNDDVKKKLNP